MSLVGQSARRREDPRLLTGRGQYVADVTRPHMLTAVVVRSRHAHALVRRVDPRHALRLPGVVACLTSEDIREYPATIPVRMGAKPALTPYLQRPLAIDRVRYVGEPLAVLLASDPYVAEDARELVEVEYEPLPAIVDARHGMAANAAPLFAEGNVADSWVFNLGDVNRALAEARFVLRRRFSVQRHTAVPMETRGLVAEWDEGREVLTVWGPTKVPYFNRAVLSSMLRLREDQIHFIEPDVGGAFGARGEFYPEDFLIPFAAMRCRRPVRWIEDRLEHFMAINHSREQAWEVALGVDEDGRLLGLDAALVSNQGAYVRTHGTLPSAIAVAHVLGPYRVPNYRCRVSCVVTNKTPAGTMRGPGFYECNFVRERALDMIAAELGLDPAEIRRRNLVRPEHMPYAVGTDIMGRPVILDTGDFPAIFEQALRRGRYEELLDHQRDPGGRGGEVRQGVGLACIAEPSGLGPFESAKVQVTPAGRIQVLTGATVMGQGQETTLAQVCADVLRVPIEHIVVRHGDTALMPTGVGTYASRAAVMAGSAVHYASLKLRDKILRLAASRLEANPADLTLDEGAVSVVGVPARRCLLKELAGLAALDIEALEATHHHRTTHETSAFTVHLAFVAVDTRTGLVTPTRYFVAIDVGRAINPMIVEGQLAGGVVQGIGGALLEELVYDDDGQLLTASFMDYLVPGAADSPPIDVLILENAPAPSNPLGVKGVGEAGTSGAGAAIANAVANALGRTGEVTTLPLTPERVLRLLRADSA